MDAYWSLKESSQGNRVLRLSGAMFRRRLDRAVLVFLLGVAFAATWLYWRAQQRKQLAPAT